VLKDKQDVRSIPPGIQYGSEGVKGKGFILKRVQPRASLAYVGKSSLYLFGCVASVLYGCGGEH